jgi:S1-C subfamily serine protease
MTDNTRMRIALLRWLALIVLASLVLLPVTGAPPPRSESQPPWLGLGFTWQPVANSGRSAAVVMRVTPKGPSAKAGIRPGDILEMINGQRANFSDQLELILFLSEFRPGDVLRLGLIREGERVDTRLVLGEMPPELRQVWKAGLDHARRSRTADTMRD